jgi:hypothetical protein
MSMGLTELMAAVAELAAGRPYMASEDRWVHLYEGVPSARSRWSAWVIVDPATHNGVGAHFADSPEEALLGLKDALRARGEVVGDYHPDVEPSGDETLAEGVEPVTLRRVAVAPPATDPEARPW